MSPVPDFRADIDLAAVRAMTARLASLVFPDQDAASSDQIVADPDTFKFACLLHGVAPLLGQSVRAGRLTLGTGLDEWLTDQADRNATRLSRMHDELVVTLQAFDHAGIEIVPLKGTAMVLAGIAGMSWRPMADLDVLVRHEDQQAVDLAFAHAGYCFQGRSWKHSLYGPCDAGERVIHTDGEHPDNPRDIESHEAIVEMFRGFRWDITPWIVNNLREIDSARVPSDGAMSLHLAVHLSMSILESTARMLQVADFGRIASQAGASAIRQAVWKSGVEQHARFVYPAVALTARWMRNAELIALEADLRPHVAERMPGWIAGVDFHEISWAGRDERGVLDRLDLWGRTKAERSRMIAATLAPTPAQLASAGYPGSGPLAALRWYPAHYRSLLRRVTA